MENGQPRSTERRITLWYLKVPDPPSDFPWKKSARVLSQLWSRLQWVYGRSFFLPAFNLFLLYAHTTSTRSNINQISGSHTVTTYCLLPFPEEWEWGLWRERQRSTANVGPTMLQVLPSLVTQVARKHPKISTEADRKRKQKEGTYPGCSLALSASWASLAGCPTLLLAPACQCFVPVPGVQSFTSTSSSYLPKHCKGPLSFHLSSKCFLISPFPHSCTWMMATCPQMVQKPVSPLLALLFCHKYGQIK